MLKIAKSLQDDEESFRIITPYEAQQNLIENGLKQADLVWQDKCFNVDSFQGMFALYILASSILISF